MKSVIIIVIAFVLLFVPMNIFAEEYKIIITEGSAFDPSCANNDSCLNPSHLSILQGDYVSWVRIDDISMPIQSGTPEMPDVEFRVGGNGLEHTFNDIGTFPYYILDMPWIQGTIVVESVPISKPFEIRDDVSGGDCSSIGNWNPTSRVCKITQNIDGSLIIKSNDLEIDGNNHILDGHYDSRINFPTRCITVDAKLGITIKNLEIKNCGIGVSFQDVSNSVITNNIISDNFAGGIHMLASNENTIKNNQIKNNPNGGIAINGNGNLIDNNRIIDNSHLYLENELQGVGLSLNSMDSVDNIFQSNTIEGHRTGMNFGGTFEKNEVKNNKISNNEIGINLNTSEQFLVLGNIIEDNEIGIRSNTYGGDGGKNSIEENIISNNNEGIHLESKLNIVTKNTISKNTKFGLWVEPRDQHTFDYNNKIYNNNFIDNSRQVFHGETNFFTVSNFGNYWSDFSPNCVDGNSDKVCDEPYPFSSGTVGVVDSAVWVEKDGWFTSNLNEIIHEPIPKSEPIVCPQGFEPVNGKCPDNPVVEKPKELGIASFVDESKDPQLYIDRYNVEPEYKKWFDENYPEYDSIEQAVGLELTKKIPDWVKNIFGWYAQDQVSEDELLDAIQYLIDEKILIVN